MKPENSLILVKINPSHLRTLSTQWRKAILELYTDDTALIAHDSYNKVFAWLEKYIERHFDYSDSKNPGVSLYAITNKERKFLSLICLSDSRKGKDPAFKLLDITLPPDLSLELIYKLDSKIKKRLIWIVAFSISLCINLAVKKGTKFKMYAKNEGMFTLFKEMVKKDNPVKYGFSCKIESRWLVVQPIKTNNDKN